MKITSKKWLLLPVFVIGTALFSHFTPETLLAENKGADTMINKKSTPLNSSPFDCKISIISPQSISQGIWLNFEIRNNTGHDIKLLSWYSPFEGFLSDLFFVTDHQGKQLTYQGPKVKRLNPQSSDFIKLKANEKRNNELDLTLVYPLEKGDYRISLAPRTLQYKGTDTALLNYSCPQQTLPLHIN